MSVYWQVPKAGVRLGTNEVGGTGVSARGCVSAGMAVGGVPVDGGVFKGSSSVGVFASGAAVKVSTSEIYPLEVVSGAAVSTGGVPVGDSGSRKAGTRPRWYIRVKMTTTATRRIHKNSSF